VRLSAEDWGRNNRVKMAHTDKQGQYLAFIYYYTKVNGQPPAEADMQRYFRVTPPSVHQNGADAGGERFHSAYSRPRPVNPSPDPTRAGAGPRLEARRYSRLRSLFLRLGFKLAT